MFAHSSLSLRIRGIALFLLCLFLPLLLPFRGQADSSGKTVRVGWYESAFHRTDSFGRKSGYGYEYQQRVSIYTGWTYEYVEGSWSELLEKLIAGEIDLLSDVSHTPERAEKILFSSEPMGSEGYHVFIAPGNNEIRADDFSTLNGKRVGVNKNSIQEELFITWARGHGITPEVVESTEKTPVLMDMLAKGDFDALVTLDTYGNSSNVVPVWKIGFAQSYFGINKNRPDLKRDLDAAMNRLLEDNRDYNQLLTEKFNKAGTVSGFLTPEEKEWLAGHEVIRVGYLDNLLPFCDLDEETGELTGALKEFLAFAENSQRNGRLRFTSRAFATAEEALKALSDHEIDCVFPISLSPYDGEQRGIILTDPVVKSEMYAIIRIADQHGIDRDTRMTAALVSSNPGYVTFVRDYFPLWGMTFFPSDEDAFGAVASGKADCALVSSYRLSRKGEQLVKAGLSALATNEVMDASYGINREDGSLFSILNKATRQMPDSMVNSVLTEYSIRSRRISLTQFLRVYWPYFLAALSIVAVIILLLVLKNVRNKTRAEEGQRIISEAELDPLTGLYNWNFFLVYANQMLRDHPGRHMEAAVVNIDRFHSINALHGRDYGDQILRELGGMLYDFALKADGIASRSHADRFNLYCPEGQDWQALLDQLQSAMDTRFDKASVHLRMGVKPWQEGMEPELQLDKARTACRKTRGMHKSRVTVFDAEMERREDRDQRLLNDLNHAIDRHELEVHYQPKYRIQSPQPVLAGAEALVRWRHPELGMISPEDFIGLFERSGQISILDSYVWEESARQVAAWRDRYHFTLPVSVNLSRVDVFDPDLISILDGLISRYGLKSGDLKLEVTESAYTENADQLIRVIGELRRKGYQIEMDDFGSGYSSLNMLSSLPLDVLKMDIAFIRNIERDEKDFRLVKLIIDIARYLRVPVVAEGVETEKQFRLLKDAGCDLVQGYYFSRPLPAEEFERQILSRESVHHD